MSETVRVAPSPSVRGRWAWPRSLQHFEFVLALAAVGGLWQLASVVAHNQTLVPPPLLVLRAWIALWAEELPTDILASLVHLGIGYTLGVGAGLLLALLAARFEVVEAIVDP